MDKVIIWCIDTSIISADIFKQKLSSSSIDVLLEILINLINWQDPWPGSDFQVTGGANFELEMSLAEGAGLRGGYSTTHTLANRYKRANDRGKDKYSDKDKYSHKDKYKDREVQTQWQRHSWGNFDYIFQYSKK